jgi:adenylyltransferase/sulfurtransferase
MLGTVQATESIKYLAGVGDLLTNSLLTFDALTMQWQRFAFAQRPDCALCGKEPTIHKLKEYAFQPCKSI